eukprot:SAG11_NODE_402_length_9751_cov_7.372047_5_plen_134_part_00
MMHHDAAAATGTARQAMAAAHPEIFGHMRRFRAKMDARKALVAGPFVSLTDPTASEALAGTVDFLWYDQEHTPIAPEQLGLHLMAAHSKGPTPCLVRIPGPNGAPGRDLAVPWGAWIKPILDMVCTRRRQKCF